MKDKRIKLILIGSGVLLTLLLIFSFFIRGKNNQEVEEGVRALIAYEKSDLKAAQEGVAAMEKEKQKENELKSIKNTKKRTEKAVKSGAFKKMFENSVVVGDSIVEGLDIYKMLYKNNILYHRGLSISEAGSLIQKAIKLHPQKIFLTFGINDMKFFYGKADDFCEAYKKKVQMIQTAIPDCEIYINSVQPVQEWVVKKDPHFASWKPYNKALIRMCKELNVTFINNVKIPKTIKGVYEGDGIHMHYEYYPRWLLNMAEKAGLA